mgnify:CR=1 FL=1|jgi:hypothetical protein
MNFELLSKLAIEENEKLKTEISLLRTRNNILHKEVERLEALLKANEDEKNSFKSEVQSLKSALEFKDEKDKDEKFSYYS